MVLVCSSPLLTLYNAVEKEVVPRAVQWEGPVVPEHTDIADHGGPLLGVQPVVISFPVAASIHPDASRAIVKKVAELRENIMHFSADVGCVVISCALSWRPAKKGVRLSPLVSGRRGSCWDLRDLFSPC